MKILVTGSEGFIGKHLVLFLRKKGYEVITFDIVKGQDLLDTKQLNKVFKKNIDNIIHLAAYGDVYKAVQDPAGAMLAGPAATANLVKVANNYPIKKIIYASTWEVYGQPVYSPIDEDHPCSPFNPYSIAKFSGELVIKSVTNSVPWLILRLGTVYGPKMRSYAVIPIFINNALQQKPVVLQGQGRQTRQFVYIDDVCRAFYKAMISHEKNQVFNIVGNENISIKDVAKKINKYIPLKTVVAGKRIGDPINAVISNKRARKKLKWKPVVGFDEGIIKLISEIKSSRQK